MHFEKLFGVASLFVLLVLVWASWFFRYDVRIIASQEGYAVAYRLDRWTGNLRLLDNDQWFPVVRGDADDQQGAFSSKESNS